MSKMKKAFNFDLNTSALKKYYCKTNAPLEYLKAYKEIKKFMKENGFSHRQWSGYTSIKTMDKVEVVMFAEKLSKHFPWLSNCVKRFDVTDIGNQYDLTDTIKSFSEKPELNLSAEVAKNSLTEVPKESKSDDRETVKKETVTIDKDVLDKLVETCNNALAESKRQSEIISFTNRVFNEHPEIKEAFIKAKAESLQRKTEKEKGGLNDTKSESKISEHKKKSHKPKL